MKTFKNLHPFFYSFSKFLITHQLLNKMIISQQKPIKIG